jgi:hypothetical protein
LKPRGTAAHTGPGRRGPEAWPPRKKAGAEERSPSAPLLGPSIVKEPGGEAPRIEAGEPHPPSSLPSGGDFAAFNEPFEPRSPRLEARQGHFAPRSLSLASLSLPFRRREPAIGPHSLLLASREGRGTAHSPPGEPSEGQGMERESLFGSCTLQETRPDLWGMPRDLRGMSPSPHFVSHLLQREPSDLRGMPRSKRFGRPEIPTKPV